MISALILICALQSTCTPTTARQVIRVPETFASPVSCFIRGQAYFAETAMAADLGADEIVRVVCR